MKKKYYVKFETGSRWAFDAHWYDTIQEAKDYAARKGYSGIYSIRRFDGFNVDGSGFKPHYSNEFQRWVETRGEYNRLLKENNLVELGNDKPDIAANHEAWVKENRKNYNDESVVDYLRDTGHSLTDGDAKEILSITDGD